MLQSEVLTKYYSRKIETLVSKARILRLILVFTTLGRILIFQVVQNDYDNVLALKRIFYHQLLFKLCRGAETFRFKYLKHKHQKKFLNH